MRQKGENMQIVIDIDNESYWMCKDLHGDADPVKRAIANGTPLPKGHGRLVDAKELKRAFVMWRMAVQGYFTDADIESIICNSSPIIEADKAESNSETPNKWIPVSERLPEENKTVIASTKYGVYPETKYTKEYGWEWAYEAGADYWKELEDVTAWMPLPELYKTESEEDKKNEMDS